MPRVHTDLLSTIIYVQCLIFYTAALICRPYAHHARFTVLPNSSLEVFRNTNYTRLVASPFSNLLQCALCQLCSLLIGYLFVALQCRFFHMIHNFFSTYTLRIPWEMNFLYCWLSFQRSVIADYAVISGSPIASTVPCNRRSNFIYI